MNAASLPANKTRSASAPEQLREALPPGAGGFSPLVSMFASVTAKSNTIVEARAILDDIRGGRWQAQVEKVRTTLAAQGKNAADEIKKTLPAVTWPGTFDGGHKATALAQHSGLLCLDFDHLNGDLESVRAQLAGDPHTMALFVSPSGTGVKLLITVDADATTHGRAFDTAAAYYRKTYGLDADAACRDVCRLCVVSHDSTLIYHQDAKTFEVPPAPAPAPMRKATPAPRPRAPSLPRTVEALIANGVFDGTRHERALFATCQLRDAGFSPPEVEGHVLTFAARCTPPLSDGDARAAVKQAFSRPARDPARDCTAPAFSLWPYRPGQARKVKT